MSEKTKALPSINAELHTISPLPIELVAEQIASLHYTGFPTVIDETTGNFIIKHSSSKNVRLEGRIMRWNGTFTRLDAAPKAQSVREWASFILPVVGLLIVTVLILFSIEDFLSFLLVIFLLWPVSLFAFGLIYGGAYLGRSGDRKTKKALDEMMQALADKITAGTDGALEFDGSELSLEMLLSDEKYKHFRLSDDGEFESA